MINVVTHLMPPLSSVANEIAFAVTYEELVVEHIRDQLALTVAAEEGAWNGVDPDKIELRQIAQRVLSDAADVVRDSFGPGSRYRVLIEILVGEPTGTR
ncbi:hypothetical protein [Streptomyces sp. NPDC001667]